MNILFVHPYIKTTTPVLYLNEPMGLISLATYLEANAEANAGGRHWNISLLDLYALGYERVRKSGEYYNIGVSDSKEIVELIRKYSPDVIGISNNFTTYMLGVFNLVNLLKEEFPKALIVVGGAHATMEAKNVLEATKADVVVRGEGEITFLELVQRHERGEGFDGLLGVTYRHDGKIVTNPPRPLMPDINILPVPARKYIDQNVYSTVNSKMYFLSKGDRIASIMTSRGCPFDCVFCSTRVVWERRFRARRTELVKEEIERLISDYGINELIINDDQFFLDKKRVHAICDEIIKMKWKVNLNVASGSSVWLMDEELLRKLKSAGLYRITFPIETGSKNTIKYIRKPIDLDKTKKLIALANSMGLYTYANFIIGFPYETREDIQKTIDYAFKSGLDNATFFIAKPYAGSEMYEHFKKEGLLEGNVFAPTTMGEVNGRIVHLSAEELQQIRDRAQRRYFLVILSNYLNPFFFYKYFYRKINSIEGFRYFVKMSMNTLRYFLIKPAFQKLRVGR